MWKHLPFFYGWVIVGVTAVCFAVGYATWHSFSIFYVAILEDFGWSRAVTAGAFSVFTVVYGLYSPISGALADRFGPRVILPLAGVTLGVSLLLTTRMTDIWQFYLLFGVAAAVGLNGFGTVPTFSMLQHWFVKKRGTAAGYATAGIGVGTLVLVPLLQNVIINHGWRTAYTVLGTTVLVVVPLLTFTFMRHRPQPMGLMPDGERPGTRLGAGRSEGPRADALVVDREWASRDWSLGSALRTHRFWYAFVARGLELGCIQVLLTHQAAFFGDMGYDKLLAASIVGTAGVMGSGAKIMWGIVSDRFGREVAFAFSFATGTVGIGIILSVHPGSPVWLLYAYALAYGLCYGASAVLLAVSSADLFQGRRYGSILGGLYIGGGIGSAIGAFLGGYVFDVMGSYTLAFAMVVPAMWLACLLYWLAGPRKVRLVAGQAGRAARLAAGGTRGN